MSLPDALQPFPAPPTDQPGGAPLDHVPPPAVDSGTAAELRRALRSAGVRIPQGEPELIAWGTRSVYGYGDVVLRVEESAASDNTLARRFAALADLFANVVPVARPLRAAPLRSGPMRLSVWERVYNVGPVDFEQLGDAVRRLHHAPTWCYDGIDSVPDPQTVRSTLERFESRLGTDILEVLLEALDSGGLMFALPERCCHGGLTLRRVLWDGSGPRLVGWDRMARGSASSDLAYLSRSIDAALDRPDERTAARAAFESGYGQPFPDEASVELLMAVRDAMSAARLLDAGGDATVHVGRVLAGRELWSAR